MQPASLQSGVFSRHRRFLLSGRVVLLRPSRVLDLARVIRSTEPRETNETPSTQTSDAKTKVGCHRGCHRVGFVCGVWRSNSSFDDRSAGELVGLLDGGVGHTSVNFVTIAPTFVRFREDHHRLLECQCRRRRRTRHRCWYQQQRRQQQQH